MQNIEVAEAARLHVSLAGEMLSGWHEAAIVAMQTTNLPRDRQSECIYGRLVRYRNIS